LPERIINRPKKGFQSPTNKWFREEMVTLKAILLTVDSEFSKIFNQNYISEILEQHEVGFNREKQIFLLLSIYYWFESNEIIIHS
jgi:asparagine synthase (glutamine-hydrolysing)